MMRHIEPGKPHKPQSVTDHASRITDHSSRITHPHPQSNYYRPCALLDRNLSHVGVSFGMEKTSRVRALGVVDIPKECRIPGPGRRGGPSYSVAYSVVARATGSHWRQLNSPAAGCRTHCRDLQAWFELLSPLSRRSVAAGERPNATTTTVGPHTTICISKSLKRRANKGKEQMKVRLIKGSTLPSAGKAKPPPVQTGIVDTLRSWVHEFKSDKANRARPDFPEIEGVGKPPTPHGDG